MTRTSFYRLGLFPTLFFAFSLAVLAQQPNFKYPLRGGIQDKDGTLIPGLSLSINGERVSDTDINGQFYELVSEGDLVLTSSQIDAKKFKVFLKIRAGGVNPGFLELVVDSASISCGEENGKSLPKITMSATPRYPAAARAILAMGGVLTEVKIDEKGNVLDAKVVSGHPLLRSASLTAAKEFKFEAAEGVSERNVKLKFIFLADQTERTGTKRYECPYRPLVRYIPL